MKYEQRKSIQVIMSFLENLILVFGVMTSHFTSSVQLRAFVNFLTTILKMFMSSSEGGRNRQLEKNCPPPHHSPRFSKMISSKGILHVHSCQCVSSQTSNSRGHGLKGGYLVPPPPQLTWYRYLNKGLTKGP